MTPILLRADQEGERLDQFLSRSVEGLTRSAAQRLLEEGAVTVNGRGAKKNTRTAPGDAVALSLPTRSRWTSSPRTSPWTWSTRTTTSLW